MIRRPPKSPLFPTTPLFRSVGRTRFVVLAQLVWAPAALGAQGQRLTVETIMRGPDFAGTDRKSTRLNSSHSQISYAVFCLKKKKKQQGTHTSQLPQHMPYRV